MNRKFRPSRRGFLLAGSALIIGGSQRSGHAQSPAAMSDHEKALLDAAKAEGGELTWYTAHSDDITAQALGARVRGRSIPA